MDGLVSTGKQIPCTILKNIFANQKKFSNYFINIFIWLVDKAVAFLILVNKKTVPSLKKSTTEKIK